MKRSWLILALLLSLGVNVGLVGVALVRQRPFGGRIFDRPGPGWDPGARLADHLRLDGKERARFLEQQRQLAQAVRELRPRIARHERELRRELVAGNPDPARVEALQNEIADASRQLDRAFADNVLKTREILEGRAEREYLRFVERFPGARRHLLDPRDARRPHLGPRDPSRRPPDPRDHPEGPEADEPPPQRPPS